MLNFIGMVLTAALMMLLVNALTSSMEVSRAAKVAIATVTGVWIGLCRSRGRNRLARNSQGRLRSSASS